MSNQSSIYNEKKIGYFESTFRTGMLSKPQEVNITITAAHVYGLGYIMEQNGTKEGDPVYTRFTCSLDEITKVYINENVKASPLYIQCDTTNKSILIRKRIIIPCLENPAAAVEMIEKVKAQYDEKMQKSRERAKAQKSAETPAPAPVAETPAPVQEAPAPAPVVESKAAEKYKPDIKKLADEGLDKAKNAFSGLGSKMRNKFVKNDKTPELPPQIDIEIKQPASFEEIMGETKPVKPAVKEETKAEPEIKEEIVEEAVKETAAESVPELKEVPLVEDITAEEEAVIEEVLKEDTSKPKRPKVTIEELIKLNNSIEIEIDTPAEPPITGGKVAEGILSELAAPEKKNELPSDSELISEDVVSGLVLEEMTVENAHHTEEPDLSDLKGLKESELLSTLSDFEEDIKPAEEKLVIEDILPIKAVEAVKEIEEPVPEIVESATAEEVKPEPVIKEEAPAVEESPMAEAAEDAYTVTETIAETADLEVSAEEEASKPAPEITQVHIDFSSELKNDMSLDDFQNAVKKLKSMLDEGVISKEEFTAEKKKLLANLY